MKHRRILAGLLAGGLLMAGCSGGGQTASQQPKEVSAACSMDQDGMKLTLVASAPSKDSKVDKTQFNFIFPTGELAKTLEDSGLSEEQIKENLAQSEEIFKSTISAQLGVEEDDITVQNTDDDLKLSIDIKDFAQVADKLGIQVSEDDMIYTEFVSQLESSGFACE